MTSLARLSREIVSCRACPRLVRWREDVAATKRAAFKDHDYWGKPVPGFGDPRARVLVLGLAPAAHGANRTGRVFTGDESGRWLYRALFREGFANQESSTSRDDGLELKDAWVTATVRCAPPGNKPSRAEEARCAPFLERELEAFRAIGGARVIVCLGGIAFGAALALCHARGFAMPRPKPRFAHGAEIALDPAGPTLLASYHPSQQNTFTRRLTEPMLDRVFARAREILRRSREMKP